MGGPYMLFATAEFSVEVSNPDESPTHLTKVLQKINDILHRISPAEDEQMLWTMQSATYKGLPRFEGNPRKSMPIPSSKFDSFHSDFISKSLEELASFLKQSPEDLQIDRDYFVAVDEETKKKGTICLCKVLEGKVLSYRNSIDEAGLDVGNLSRPNKFDEMMRRAKEKEGREDDLES